MINFDFVNNAFIDKNLISLYIKTSNVFIDTYEDINLTEISGTNEEQIAIYHNLKGGAAAIGLTVLSDELDELIKCIRRHDYNIIIDDLKLTCDSLLHTSIEHLSIFIEELS